MKQSLHAAVARVLKRLHNLLDVTMMPAVMGQRSGSQETLAAYNGC